MGHPMVKWSIVSCCLHNRHYYYYYYCCCCCCCTNPIVLLILALCSLPYDRSTAPSKASSPQMRSSASTFNLQYCYENKTNECVWRYVNLLHYWRRKPPKCFGHLLWVRIPPGAWIFVCCECRVLSGRGLCDELITRPEESYRLCFVVACDLETSRMGAPYIYIYIYIYIWH